ncbi:pathogenesis-related homeodomain protein isoform X2 [Nymphaea colorata]|uniref:pathogenesis-related homeodomain protein isoform X2 n=1 Tax=Nymphaea colorata TaxID=210225 RepID=UPI00129EF014|nr:pathogenesis-related homeodomain protein isoform X2 [Nymphaea colorata]
MRGAGKIVKQPVSRKSSMTKRLMGYKMNPTPQKKIPRRYRMKPKSCVKSIRSARAKNKVFEASKKHGDTMERISDQHGEHSRTHTPTHEGSYKCYIRRSLMKDSDDKLLKSGCKGKRKDTNVDDGIQKNKRKRRRKSRKENIHSNEALRLQRRTKYLLIKMRLEQNLIDAYSGEGWKGQSREKIKPEKELRRAEEQILKCKLGIRDAMHQLDLLSFEGRIEDSVIAQDGSVFHEHIFCAKCKLRDAFPDNDIILCDGTCNCAFHQKCLDPPLATENIPPEDEGWLCKICECKMEILDTLNAYLGTSYSMDNGWEDVFKEAVISADGGNVSLNHGDEWPSDDSEDDDYDPDKVEEPDMGSGYDDAHNDASSSGGWSSDVDSLEDGISFLSEDLNSGYNRPQQREEDADQPFDSVININSDNEHDIDFKNCGRRKRRDVDYKKLYDEMFGKEPCESEHLSEDEDWGPQRKKRRDKDPEMGSSSAPQSEDKILCTGITRHEEKNSASTKDKKQVFRIPSSAVEKLRVAFIENELPSRKFKEDLSKQLGLAYEKEGKQEETRKEPPNVVQPSMEITRRQDANQAGSRSPIPSTASTQAPESRAKISRRLRTKLSISSRKEWKKAPTPLPADIIERLEAAFRENQFPSVSLKRKLSRRLHIPYYQVSFWFRSMVNGPIQKRKAKVVRRGITSKPTSASEITSDMCEKDDEKRPLFVLMERLFQLEDKIDKLKGVLRAAVDSKDDVKEVNVSNSDKQIVMYVPVVELRENTIICKSCP